MKTITCWDDLCPYGIVPLTGEVCRLSDRVLCDVTASGKKILEKALGVAELRLHEHWNLRSADAPRLGMIMLVPEILPFVGVFALLAHGCREVWITKGGCVIGMEPADYPEQVEKFLRVCADKLSRHFTDAGTTGDRNVHLITGQIE